MSVRTRSWGEEEPAEETTWGRRAVRESWNHAGLCSRVSGEQPRVVLPMGQERED